MKNKARIKSGKGRPGYRTPSTFRNNKLQNQKLSKQITLKTKKNSSSKLTQKDR